MRAVWDKPSCRPGPCTGAAPHQPPALYWADIPCSFTLASTSVPPTPRSTVTPITITTGAHHPVFQYHHPLLLHRA